MNTLSRTAAGLALALSMTSFAQADTIRATSGLGPSHVMATDVYPKLFEKLSEFTEGRWDGRDTPSGLVSLQEMNSALRDGVTEMGVVLMPYFAADYPESSLINDLGLLGKNNLVISAAATEYVLTCPECLAEFSKSGQVFLGGDSTPPYNFLSTKRIESAEDAAGVRFRTASPVYAAFVESIGGIPVQMSASELFEGLSQGVLEATVSSSADLINARLFEVVKHVTEVEQGVFAGGAITNVSQLLWMRMDAADRAALARAAQYGIAEGLFAWVSTVEEARQVAGDAGVEFVTPDASMVAAQEAFNAQFIANLPATLEGRGVKDAQAKMDRYVALIEKWKGLVEGVDTPEAYAELRYNELWANVDYDQFGQ